MYYLEVWQEMFAIILAREPSEKKSFMGCNTCGSMPENHTH